MNLDIEERIKRLLDDEKDYILGFANLSGLLAETYDQYTFAIVVGKKLDSRIVDSVATGPNPEYMHHYRQINRDLSALAHRISAELKAMKISSLVIEPTVNDDELDDRYYKTLRTDFSHKMAATRAGLGWIGKTALFISKAFGPRVRLVTILTDYPLACRVPPIDESQCGECRVCVDKCPARAANGKAWTIHIERDEFYNPFKCRETCLELSWQKMKLRTSICGICVSVCPKGKYPGEKSLQ